MLKKWLKKLLKKSSENERGSVLSVTLVILVVLTASVTAITHLSINQSNATSIKLNSVNDEVTGKRFIQLAISEFETYMVANESFDDYENNEVPNVLTNYNVTVTNVTGDPGFENFGTSAGGESRAYRFAYSLNNGNTLVMYSFVSTTGSTTQNFNPFDYSIGTNGDLILGGGYFGEGNLFGEDIYFFRRVPYTRTRPNGRIQFRVTPSNSSTYPDFLNDGSTSIVQPNDEYVYCRGNCWRYNGVNNPYTFQKSEFRDISGSALEQGTHAPIQIVNFFGNFDYDQTVIDFVKDVGPTDDREINDAMTINNIRDIVMANSGAPVENCWYIWCWSEASPEPYTDITNDPYFTPLTNEETIRFGAVYDGDLTVRRPLHMSDRHDEALVITGDLIIDNPNYITMDGKFVVLGDLIFQGATVDVDGAFYVLGETILDFDYGEGLQERGNTDEYGLTFMLKDNIKFLSMWQSTSSSALPQHSLEAFIYTEESVYIEAIRNRVYYRGVIFAAAKGVSGNSIPIQDESNNPINGVVINSYRGYINGSGSPVPSNSINRNGFYFLKITEQYLQDTFTEIPEFESILFSEGEYTFETSEFGYE